MHVKGVHEIYCCGARVRISGNGVEVLSEPLIEYCPLHEALYGTKKIDVDAFIYGWKALWIQRLCNFV